MEKINIEVAKNEDAMMLAVGQVRRQLEKIAEGGGN